MNPVLKKIKSAHSSRDIVDLLERHIGLGNNKFHCEQAYEALMGLQDHQLLIDLKSYLEAINILSGSHDIDACCKVRRAIRYLRGK